MRIGMRNIKTAISVLICLLIYILIVFIAFAINKSVSRSVKIATQLYTPFFACLAAAYSVSSNRTKSLGQAKLRLLASLIGGLFGLLIVSIYQLTGHEWPFQHISATGNPTYDKTGFFETGWLAGDPFTAENLTTGFILSFIPPIILSACAVVIVIWFCNIIGKSDCAFIAVLTLTAVMCSLGTNPIVYGPNRILSTMIGIAVALVVNLGRHHVKHNDNVKLIFSLDGMYLQDKDKLSGFKLYKLEKLIEQGADVTLYTTRTPSTLQSMIRETQIKQSVICMSGACVYDFNKKEYSNINYIDSETCKKLNDLFEKLNIDPFISKIQYNHHYVYTKELNTKSKNEYFNEKKDQAYTSFIINDYINSEDIVYYMILDNTENINVLEEEIKKLGLDDIIVLKLDSSERNQIYNGNSYLKIYSKKILDLKYIKDDNKINFAFVAHKYDYILSNNCDEIFEANLTRSNLVKDAKEIEKLFKKAFKVYNKSVKK